jgi:nitrite reductase/ring-hydroxylating ferredoxin subunit
MNLAFYILLISQILASWIHDVDGFSFVLMGRGRGNLKRALSDNDGQSKKRGKGQDPTASLNEGKGQEITGVTLPAEGMIKGWEFGEKKIMACGNVGGQFYAIQGDCPRCGFDLWKGTLISDDPGFEDLPRVACPTCATTFSMKSGMYGPPLKKTGLAGFVSGLAKTATANQERNCDAFQITVDSDSGRVFCRQRPKPRTII